VEPTKLIARYVEGVDRLLAAGDEFAQAWRQARSVDRGEEFPTGQRDAITRLEDEAVAGCERVRPQPERAIMPGKLKGVIAATPPRGWRERCSSMSRGRSWLL